MKYFTIFGNPVSHSKSPLMHNNAFKSINFDGCYTRYLLNDGNQIIEKFKSLKIKGASVTVPHKENAYEKCDEVRGIAKDIKAVNLLILEGDKIIGYNTDAPGFMEAISDFDYNNVLILGAGGTAKALSLMMPEAHIINRSEGRLKYFRDKNITSFTWDEFEIKNYDLIINSTSAGLNDDNYPIEKEILDKLFEYAKYAVDVIYTPTPFQNLAKEKGLIVRDGSHMLVYQGVLAFEKFVYPQKIDKKEIANSMFEAIN
jgi:shikimate dehydrogenase